MVSAGKRKRSFVYYLMWLLACVLPLQGVALSCSLTIVLTTEENSNNCKVEMKLDYLCSSCKLRLEIIVNSKWMHVKAPEGMRCSQITVFFNHSCKVFETIANLADNTRCACPFSPLELHTTCISSFNHSTPAIIAVINLQVILQLGTRWLLGLHPVTWSYVLVWKKMWNFSSKKVLMIFLWLNEQENWAVLIFEQDVGGLLQIAQA